MKDQCNGIQPSPYGPPPESVVGALTPGPTTAPTRTPSIHLWLFLITLATTTLAGSFLEMGQNLPEATGFGELIRVAFQPSQILKGVPFSFSLLLILGCHEMGHYLACRHYGVDASLPYFLPMLPFPFPPFLGTIGAFIRIRGPIPSRDALFDIGAAGPMAGFLVTLPVLFLGLHQSEVILLPENAQGVFLGEPLLFRWMSAPLLQGLPESATLQIGSVALAGWIGLLATSLNLLPVGQLDGGHICYSVSRRFHAVVSRYTMAGFLLFAVVWHSYLLWAILLFVLGRRHPPVLEETNSLSPGRVLLTWASLGVFLVSFIPNPIRLP